jgi:hypothetical protein
LAALAASAEFSGIDEIKGMRIYEKLSKLEARAHRLQEISCNTGEDFDAKEARILAQVRALLPDAKEIFINGDPRGYSLKIKGAEVERLRVAGINIYTDFGGYGILAPEF